MHVVVKLGTSSLTGELGAIDTAFISRLCDQVAELRAAGHRVVIVSSGAISAGVAALDMATRPSDIRTLQAIAAVGQHRLMTVWSDTLATHGIVAAQVLLVPHDFINRRQYLHTRRMLARIEELGCVPIVNENDAIASDEIRFGDNDRIAALVAHNIGADLLVMLTDTEGLYTADPRTNPDASLIAQVRADDPLLDVQAAGRGSARGSGGMASKLAAARVASASGVVSVIASSRRANVLTDAVAGEPVGTTFLATSRRVPARKLWIAHAARPAGRVTVDDGAARALVERGRSLLPAGVTAVGGTFHEGDVVDVVTATGEVIARGLVQVGATDLRSVAGMHTAQLPSGVRREVIHRDDLVLLVDAR